MIVPLLEFIKIFGLVHPSFLCDNKGNCVIYCTPQENELSKSPVTLSLYEENILDGDYGKQLSLVGQKKIGLLQRNIIGG